MIEFLVSTAIGGLIGGIFGRLGELMLESLIGRVRRSRVPRTAGRHFREP